MCGGGGGNSGGGNRGPSQWGRYGGGYSGGVSGIGSSMFGGTGPLNNYNNNNNYNQPLTMPTAPTMPTTQPAPAPAATTATTPTTTPTSNPAVTAPTYNPMAPAYASASSMEGYQGPGTPGYGGDITPGYGTWTGSLEGTGILQNPSLTQSQNAGDYQAAINAWNIANPDNLFAPTAPSLGGQSTPPMETPQYGWATNPQYWGSLDDQWNQYAANPSSFAEGTDMGQAYLNFVNAGGLGTPGALRQAGVAANAPGTGGTGGAGTSGWYWDPAVGRHDVNQKNGVNVWEPDFTSLTPTNRGGDQPGGHWIYGAGPTGTQYYNRTGDTWSAIT